MRARAPRPPDAGPRDPAHRMMLAIVMARIMWGVVTVQVLLSVGGSLPVARGTPKQSNRVHSDELAVASFTPLPVGSVTPEGWLLEQLKLQAEGLSGHLAMFWPPVAESIWTGGNATEHIPGQFGAYWLNGLTRWLFSCSQLQFCNQSAEAASHKHAVMDENRWPAHGGSVVPVGPSDR